MADLFLVKIKSIAEMDLRENNNLLRETIAFPVRYDKHQQTIRDSRGMMVCDIRGWGKIQYMNKAVERQDAIGEKIASLLNEHTKTAAEVGVIK